MPKMIYICILLIYFKVISKKGGHYCPRLPYCVLITNSYVLSIALYEFRQVVNVPGLPYEISLVVV